MKIAVIGTGIAGLAAAWVLHKEHEITVYEAAPRTGGHANTVTPPSCAPVDTGFIVYNERTYPHFIALLAHLGVASDKTDMSFGVSLDGGRLEYSSSALFASPRNALSPRFYRMIWDILRFYRASPRDLAAGALDGLSLDGYLAEKRYSRAFAEDHILPMTAAIWSTAAAHAGEFPAASFVRFFGNHGLLQVTKRPQWHTIRGGSRRYVDALTAPFRERIRLACPARSVTRKEDHVLVRAGEQNEERFDKVILAAHPDEALACLTDPCATEKAVLGAFPYAQNRAVLHRSPALMPKSRRAWSSWNVISAPGMARDAVCVTYWMNRLQPSLPAAPDLFVTLNPPEGVLNDNDILHTDSYMHPQYTGAAPAGWRTLHKIQGVRRSYFAGAWCGMGFHEDGMTAGLAAAEMCAGVKPPWCRADVSPAGRHIRGKAA